MASLATQDIASKTEESAMENVETSRSAEHQEKDTQAGANRDDPSESDANGKENSSSSEAIPSKEPVDSTAIAPFGPIPRIQPIPKPKEDDIEKPSLTRQPTVEEFEDDSDGAAKGFGRTAHSSWGIDLVAPVSASPTMVDSSYTDPSSLRAEVNYEPYGRARSQEDEWDWSQESKSEQDNSTDDSKDARMNKAIRRERNREERRVVRLSREAVDRFDFANSEIEPRASRAVEPTYHVNIEAPKSILKSSHEPRLVSTNRNDVRFDAGSLVEQRDRRSSISDDRRHRVRHSSIGDDRRHRRRPSISYDRPTISGANRPYQPREGRSRDWDEEDEWIVHRSYSSAPDSQAPTVPRSRSISRRAPDDRTSPPPVLVYRKESRAEESRAEELRRKEQALDHEIASLASISRAPSISQQTDLRSPLDVAYSQYQQDDATPKLTSYLRDERLARPDLEHVPALSTEIIDNVASDVESDASYDFSLPSTDEKWAAPPNEPSPAQRVTMRDTFMSATGALAPAHSGVKSDLKVIHSYYPDVHPGSNELSIGITAEFESVEYQDGYDPLFRWIHLEQLVMNFEGFIECAIGATGISQSEGYAISRLLDSFRNRSEKPFRNPQGATGRYFSEGVSYSRSEKHKPITFFCLPYLSLEKLTSSTLKHNTGGHVTRTLLQTLFSSAGRDRELKQAVCQIPRASEIKQHCFHVPQLWCLTYGEGLLITCARAPFSEIQAYAVNATIRSPKLSTASQTEFIHISSGRENWLLPVKDCKTWFELVAHFAGLTSPTDVFCGMDYCICDTGVWCFAIKYRKKLVTAGEWANIIEESRTSQIRLTLTKRSKRQLQPPVRTPSLPSEDETEASSTDAGYWSEENTESASDGPAKSDAKFHFTPWQSPKEKNKKFKRKKNRNKKASLKPTAPSNQSTLDLAQGSSISVEDFHVFTWIAARPSSISTDEIPIYVVEGHEINAALISGMRYLQNNPKSKEQEAFRNCPQRTLQEVREQVKYMERDGIHYGVYSCAKDILRFFLPLNLEAQIVLKYWGAVSEIINNLENLQAGDYENMQAVAKIARSLTASLSAGRAPPVYKLRVPNQFVKAWLHCLSYFVLLGVRPKHGLYNHHGQKFFDGLQRGWADLIGLVCKTPLKKAEAVPPMVIVMKLCHRLLHDNCHRLPPNRADEQIDLISSYWTYVSQLKIEIDDKPLLREHQRKLNLLKQEVGAAKKIFEEQLSVMKALKRQLQIQQAQSINPFQEERRELSMTRECIVVIEAKLQGLDDILNRAIELGSEHLTLIDSNKDRQEAAIYIFTTVTVIFLPLTFVAGVLGMNTNDIRNMTINQWVFWVTAIPFTVLVIATCLLFTGELSDFWLSLSRIQPFKSPKSTRSVLVPENQGALPLPPATPISPIRPPFSHPTPMFSNRRRDMPPTYADHITASQPYDSRSLYQESMQDTNQRIERHRADSSDDDGASTVRGSTYGAYRRPRRRGTEDWLYNV